jgi:hypothetical protein
MEGDAYNVEPRPTSDSAQQSPPRSRDSVRLMERPRPESEKNE